MYFSSPPLQFKVYNGGFSLVELSIVLVILGLLVGGVMTGNNLIKAAEMRSVTTEFQQYQTAVNLFQETYMGLPGDLDNATEFWGETTSGGGCGTDGVGSNTQPGYLGGDAMADGTCNGDGSGVVANYWLLGGAYYESFLFWQHLQLAGLISGQYTGVRGVSSTEHHVINENAPSAKFSNGGWTAWSFDEGNVNYFDLNYGNTFQIGAQHPTNRTVNPLFTPEEAWNIDTKVDDGKPAQGSLIARGWNNTCANATANTELDADYRLTDDSAQCSLLFRNAF